MALRFRGANRSERWLQSAMQAAHIGVRGELGRTLLACLCIGRGAKANSGADLSLQWQTVAAAGRCSM